MTPAPPRGARAALGHHRFDVAGHDRGAPRERGRGVILDVSSVASWTVNGTDSAEESVVTVLSEALADVAAGRVVPVPGPVWRAAAVAVRALPRPLLRGGVARLVERARRRG